MVYVKDAIVAVIWATVWSILVACGAVCGILLAIFLFVGCGGGPQPAEVDAGEEVDAGSDSDSDVDSDSDTDSDTDPEPCRGCAGPFEGKGNCSPIGSCDEEQGSVCIGIDTWAPSCPNGTCDCGEDSDSCPLDCPATWTECTLLPEDGPSTCDSICEARGMFCTESCESDTDGNLHGAEGCGGSNPPGSFGTCSISWSPGDGDDALRCCCGREA